MEGLERKKHVYLDASRIPGDDAKKSHFPKEKMAAKAVLLKISHNPEKIIVNRSKRDVEDIKEVTETLADVVASKRTDADFKVNDSIKEKQDKKDIQQMSDSSKSQEHELMKKTENKVQEDNHPTIKNNDTDKTLFVHDAQKYIKPTEDVPVVQRINGEHVLMKKTIVDDGLNLYPVYRGVKYFYPFSERRDDSSELTLEMATELPQPSDTEDSPEEGRSRRPLKKLALPLLLALKLKTAILLPLILGLVALISFKGLWSGVTALGIAAALGLKALVAGSTKVLVHNPPPPPSHFHHFPPHEITEYWSRRGDDYVNDYRPTSWT